MSIVDFDEWAVQDLVLPLRGRKYVITPPSVGDMGKLLAAAVLGEVHLGIVKGPMPDELQRILDDLKPDEHPALGPVYQQLVDDGVHPTVIDRMAYYSTFYWARGKAYADWLGAVLWTPRDLTAGDGGGAPRKGSRRRKTGRRTA